jgi:predicted dithiol-disulfide oxidoreductase (DUF899 family)
MTFSGEASLSGVSYAEDRLEPGAEHNYRPLEPHQLDPSVLPVEAVGMSAFALDDGAVYHTYSTYARGTDALWGMYQWLERAPLGRNESGPWFRRHDEYNGN